MSKNNMVLGAGAAGLGAWYADNGMQIYEASNEAGGLCGVIDIQRFQFDKAVHLSFSNIDLVKDLFMKTEHYTHHPVPKSWYHTLWMKHPVQNNLYPLSAEEKVKALSGFVNRDLSIDDSNFKGWNRRRYGDYLWENFFEPYNRKYWDVDMEALGVDWIGDRIYQPSLEEMLYGSYTDQTSNAYYASEMKYPKVGGFFSFIKPVVIKAEKNKKINYGYKAVRINAAKKIVYFENHKPRKYNKIFTSIPIVKMSSIVDDMPDVLRNRNLLDHTSVAIVSIGLKKSFLKQMWFYIYDDDIMAARAYMPSVKSPQNVPNGLDSIQFEIYFNSKNSIPNEKKAVDNCVYALEKMKIAEYEDVIFTDFRILPYGNVILKNGDAKYLENIISWLESRNIYSIGRFGRWEYLWSDQSFMSGYKSVKMHS